MVKTKAPSCGCPTRPSSGSCWAMLLPLIQNLQPLQVLPRHSGACNSDCLSRQPTFTFTLALWMLQQQQSFDSSVATTTPGTTTNQEEQGNGAWIRDWAGVTCNNQDQVPALQLSRNKTRGHSVGWALAPRTRLSHGAANAASHSSRLARNQSRAHVSAIEYRYVDLIGLGLARFKLGRYDCYSDSYRDWSLASVASFGLLLLNPDLKGTNPTEMGLLTDLVMFHLTVTSRSAAHWHCSG